MLKFEINSPDYEEKVKVNRICREESWNRLHFIKFLKKDGQSMKIWECGLCGREFNHQYTLVRHLPTHTDERNYKCEECGRAFKHYSTLKQHKAIHSDEKPYACMICSKAFSRVSTLISHKKIHEDKKAYTCETCGKEFRQKGNLKSHMYTHTNERPFKCDICGRGFNQASNLQLHKNKTHYVEESIELKTPKPKYECSECHCVFNEKMELKLHMQYIHHKSNVKASNSASVTIQQHLMAQKSKIGNVQIIKLPNGDKTFKQSTTGLLIEPIQSNAMHKALTRGRPPFVLLIPFETSPVIVKVVVTHEKKQMLVPATVSDLENYGKFIVANTKESVSVQIKVPIVATVRQRVDKSGELHLDVIPPFDDKLIVMENTQSYYRRLLFGKNPNECMNINSVITKTSDDTFSEQITLKSALFNQQTSYDEDEKFSSESISLPLVEVSSVNLLQKDGAQNTTIDNNTYVTDEEETFINVDDINIQNTDNILSQNLVQSKISDKDLPQSTFETIIVNQSEQETMQNAVNTRKADEFALVPCDPMSSTSNEDAIQFIKPIMNDCEGLQMYQYQWTDFMEALNTGHLIEEPEITLNSGEEEQLTVETQPLRMVINSSDLQGAGGDEDALYLDPCIDLVVQEI